MTNKPNYLTEGFEVYLIYSEPYYSGSDYKIRKGGIEKWKFELSYFEVKNNSPFALYVQWGYGRELINLRLEHEDPLYILDQLNNFDKDKIDLKGKYFWTLEEAEKELERLTELKTEEARQDKEIKEILMKERQEKLEKEKFKQEYFDKLFEEYKKNDK